MRICARMPTRSHVYCVPLVQLLFDIEHAYAEFFRSLSSKEGAS